MATAWKPIPPNPGKYTGNLEYRIDTDGVVRFRGLATTLINGPAAVPAGAGSGVVLPAEAAPTATTYHGWTGILTDVNVVVTGTRMTIGFYHQAGSVIDLSKVAYLGTAPAPNPHTLEGVLEGLEAALGAIDGLRVYGFPADHIATPAAVLSLPEVSGIAFGDSWDFEMPVWLFISKVNDRASAAEIARYIDPRSPDSIQAAIENDRTLGGACDSVSVTLTRPQFASVAGTEYLAAEFTLEVIG